MPLRTIQPDTRRLPTDRTEEGVEIDLSSDRLYKRLERALANKMQRRVVHGEVYFTTRGRTGVRHQLFQLFLAVFNTKE